MINQPIQQQTIKKRGSGKAWAIGCSVGCLGFLVIIGIVIFAGIHWLIGLTDTAPAKLPQVVVSDRDAQALTQRLSDFSEAMKADKPASPLVLTGDDINKLIQIHPDFKELTGKVHVTIPGNAIRIEGSIPLDGLPFGSLTKGRFLNGSGTVTIQMEAGQMLMHIVSMETKGKPLPADFLKSLSEKNLAEDVNNDPKQRPVFDKIESISVQNGRLQIVPKNRN